MPNIASPTHTLRTAPTPTKALMPNSKKLVYTGFEIVDIAGQILAGLEAVHGSGIVHRDVKPANIRVLDDGTVKIMDFGLARRYRSPATDATLPQDSTSAYGISGTPAYMSPEQARGEIDGLDERADVYSLGVIFYQLLCGQLPFRGSLAAILTQIVTSAPRRPSEIRADLDPAAGRIGDAVCRLGQRLDALARKARHIGQRPVEQRVDLRRRELRTGCVHLGGGAAGVHQREVGARVAGDRDGVDG